VYGWRAMALDWTFSAGLQLEMRGLINPINVKSNCLESLFKTLDS